MNTLKKYLLASFVLLSFACTKKDANTPSTEVKSKVLNVYSWSNYINPDLIADFEKAKSVKVNLSYYSSNEELLAKLQAGAKGYDIIIPSTYMVKPMKSLGLLQPIYASKFAEVKNLDPKFRKPSHDPELEYVMPFCWGTTGLAVNTAKVKGNVDSWSWMFDHPELKGNITMLDDPAEAIAAAVKYLGFNMNGVTDEQLAKAKELLKKQKTKLKAFTSETLPILEAGEVAIAQAYSSDVGQVMKKNPQITYVIPKEGGVIWLDNLAVPKGAEHVDLAIEFIKFMTSEDAGNRQAKHIMTNPVVLLPHTSDALTILNNSHLLPSNELIGKLEYTSDDPVLYEKLNRLWTELKAE